MLKYIECVFNSLGIFQCFETVSFNNDSINTKLKNSLQLGSLTHCLYRFIFGPNYEKNQLITFALKDVFKLTKLEKNKCHANVLPKPSSN